MFSLCVFVGESSLPSLPTRLGLSTRREQDIEDLQGKRDASTQMEGGSSGSSSTVEQTKASCKLQDEISFCLLLFPCLPGGGGTRGCKVYFFGNYFLNNAFTKKKCWNKSYRVSKDRSFYFFHFFLLEVMR